MNALTGHFRSHVCPYCFEDFLLSDTPYRCANPDVRRCPPEVDALREAVWEDDTRRPRVVRPPVRLFAEAARCETCSTVSRQRLCPHCHMELPLGLGRRRSLVFAVIGAKESGKSHYLAVLITELRKRLCADLDLGLDAVNDETRERFRNEFYRPVYEEGRTIVATQTGRRLQNSVRQPLIYDLNLFGSGRHRRIRRSATLVFFDTAGEDLDREESIRIANRYVCRADGIIVLLDPLQLPYVRRRFRDPRLLPSETGETSEILSRIVRLIRKGRRRQTGRVPIPLAVAFSKFDAVGSVDGLVGPQLQLHSHPSHDGGFNVADYEAVNDEMQSLIASWGSADLIQQIKGSFTTFGFFGLSALGCNPHRNKRIPHVIPKRVEDPFLWLLYRHGFLKKSKTR